MTLASKLSEQKTEGMTLMKRLTTALLASAMLLGLAAPAGAMTGDRTESADARLARVTQRVKERLDLDTEMYGSFRGDLSEQELGTVWSLNWSGSGASLNVEALEDGTVVGLWRNDGEEDVTYGAGLPRFTAVDTAAAKQAAE